MDKKRVLFVVHQLNFGGVQKSAVTALNSLDHDRYDITLYVRTNRLDLLPEASAAVNRVIVNEDRRHHYMDPKVLWMELCGKVGSNEKKADIQAAERDYIVHKKISLEKKLFSNDEPYDVAVSYIQGFTAALVSNIPAKRRIVFFHGSTDELHELHEECFDKYDCIVGVNEAVRDVLQDLYPMYRSRITYLTNFVDAEEIVRKSRAFSVETPQEIVLCSCGRFSEVKGFDIAVEAAAGLRKEGCCFKWFFVGDGPERKTLERMISDYGLQDNIEITGMQDNPYPWIDACDIYVQPSRAEAHPLTIVEAQILCKPVVTTATVGGRKLVKNGMTGFVCDVDAIALAGAIMRLMNTDDVRDKMISELKSIDRSGEFAEYQEGWNRLLVGGTDNEI